MGKPSVLPSEVKWRGIKLLYAMMLWIWINEEKLKVLGWNLAKNL